MLPHLTSRRYVIKILLVISGLSLPLSANAYLDPGTGSVLLQSLIGILAVAAAAVGAYFDRIRRFLFHRKSGSAGVDTERSGENNER